MSNNKLTVIYQNHISYAIPIIRDIQAGTTMISCETEMRIQQIAKGLKRLPASRFKAPPVSSSELDILLPLVHHPAYLDFLNQAINVLGEEQLLFEHPFSEPSGAIDTPLTSHIYAVARESARTAMGAAISILDGDSLAYALCRPPGHHAGPNWLGGYCYLNNSVIAVHTLLNAGIAKVGLLDIDFHFGNGSAVFLENEPRVIFASIHCDTEMSYPYQKSFSHNNRQQFFSFKTSPTVDEYLITLMGAVDSVKHFGSEVIVVSVGYDIINGDPHGQWELPVTIFKDIGEILAGANIPLCLIQEGGYSIDQLEACAFNFCQGILS